MLKLGHFRANQDNWPSYPQGSLTKAGIFFTFWNIFWNSLGSLVMVCGGYIWGFLGSDNVCSNPASTYKLCKLRHCILPLCVSISSSANNDFIGYCKD